MINEKSRISKKTHRLIGAKYPTSGIFDNLTQDPDDLRYSFILEAETNFRSDRSRILQNRLDHIPNYEIVSGNTANLVMSAFLHADERGGRFNSGRLGAWYASLDISTAIRETFFHTARRLRLSEGGFPNKIRLRELIAYTDQEYVDIRNQQTVFPELYQSNPENYQISQEWGDELRWPFENEKPTENGIVYNSVRNSNGVNVCIFWPTRIDLPVIEGDIYEYNWDIDGNPQILRLSNIQF